MSQLVRVCDRYIKMPVCMYPIMTTIHYPANCKQTLCTFLDGTEVSFESDQLDWVRARIAEQTGYNVKELMILDPNTGEVIDWDAVTPEAVTVFIQPRPLPPLNHIYFCLDEKGGALAVKFSLKMAQDGTGDISVNWCKSVSSVTGGRRYTLSVLRLEETRRAEYRVTLSWRSGSMAFVFVPSLQWWFMPSAQDDIQLQILDEGLDPRFHPPTSQYITVDDTRFVE